MNVKTVLVIEGSVNVLMVLAKFAVGLKTGSAAIIADALHSLTDLINNLVAWMAVRVAEKPADSDHHYGHQKFEQLAVFFLATLLSVVAIEVLINAIRRFSQPVEDSTIGLAILAGAMVINLALSLWQKRWAEKLDSDILFADASHTFSDVLTTLAVIVGWQLATLGWYWIDTLFAILVSGLIGVLAFRLFSRAIPNLVDQNQLNTVNVRSRLLSLPEIIELRSLRIRSINNQHFADITIAVDGQRSVSRTHDLADQIEGILAREFAICDVTVHIEPYLDNLTLVK
ncbi:cation diffusion facilitator family transporter [Aliiglaciecola sp. M165]|uniref:cation diffusion facilitator family transporter n=1 Tax=Aliiglaciecola sp. M165 TaxID=2593649 RepID=UPI001180535B|nr:cation diffusion facilitator family transporter [Aliiglaciecola sp. M165]TRY29889.1 cation transporter [Aliiglaciecola sp. M165]